MIVRINLPIVLLGFPLSKSSIKIANSDYPLILIYLNSAIVFSAFFSYFAVLHGQVLIYYN
jgi:hypothetical protein